MQNCRLAYALYGLTPKRLRLWRGRNRIKDGQEDTMSIIWSVIKANLDNLRAYLPESKKDADSSAFLSFALTSILDVTIKKPL